jgi:hypothetical protein
MEHTKAALAEQWAKNFFSGNVESRSEEWTYRTGTLACIKGTAFPLLAFCSCRNRFVSNLQASEPTRPFRGTALSCCPKVGQTTSSGMVFGTAQKVPTPSPFPIKERSKEKARACWWLTTALRLTEKEWNTGVKWAKSVERGVWASYNALTHLSIIAAQWFFPQEPTPFWTLTWDKSHNRFTCSHSTSLFLIDYSFLFE